MRDDIGKVYSISGGNNMVKHIKDTAEFEGVISNGTVAVVDFYADWCGPCKMLGPVIEEFANEQDETKVSVVKVNVDDLEEIAAKYGVFSIPTIIFFKDGEVKDKLVGYRPKEHFQKIVQKLI